MQKITIDDTWNILEYERKRDEFRRRIIELKKKRRVGVGNSITLVFENRETVLFQIQEMVRIERLVDEARIVQEIEVYNSLIPDSGELSATLFIELQGREELHPALEQLIGLDRHVSLHIGDGLVIPAQFESGRAREGLISSVQYLRFPFTDEQQTAFSNGGGAATIVIDHPNYEAQATLSAGTLEELARDFKDPVWRDNEFMAMPGRTLMNRDVAFLHHAIRLAREAEQVGNLPVGAVISLDGGVVAEGKNSIWVPKHAPSRHAEIEALEAVAPELWVQAQQMTLYTTLEPCLMCTGAILLHRVGRVVFGSSDGRGGTSCIIGRLPPAFDSLFRAMEWVGPTLPQECDELNEKVFELLREHKNRG